jgi:subfamily B ATP-binding cassette protein MsbA
LNGGSDDREPMTVAASDTMPLRALLARIWRDYLSKHKGSLILSVLCAATTGLLTAALLKLLEPAVNGLFLGGTKPISLFGLVTFPADKAVVWIPVAILTVAIARTLAALGQAALVNRLGHTIVGDIQIRLFGAMIRADLARLRSQHSGGFVSSVLFDANMVREAFTSGVVNYTQNLLTLIAVLIYMGFIDWQLTIVVLLGVPLVALVLRRFGRKTRKAAVGAMAETENLSTALMENLDGVRLIKI